MDNTEFADLYSQHFQKAPSHVNCAICEEKSIRDGGVRTTVDLLSRMREQKEAETLDKVDKLNTEMKTDEIVGEMLDVATELEKDVHEVKLSEVGLTDEEDQAFEDQRTRSEDRADMNEDLGEPLATLDHV